MAEELETAPLPPVEEPEPVETDPFEPEPPVTEPEPDPEPEATDEPEVQAEPEPEPAPKAPGFNKALQKLQQDLAAQQRALESLRTAIPAKPPAPVKAETSEDLIRETHAELQRLRAETAAQSAWNEVRTKYPGVDHATLWQEAQDAAKRAGYSVNEAESFRRRASEIFNERATAALKKPMAKAPVTTPARTPVTPQGTRVTPHAGTARPATKVETDVDIMERHAKTMVK